MITFKIFSLFFVFSLTFCPNPLLKPKNPPQKEFELSVLMKRFRCRADCPAYELYVNSNFAESNGKIVFQGVNYTKTEGKVESDISQEKLNHLLNEIEKANFFSLKDAYTAQSGNCPATVTDFPTVTLYIRLNGKYKEVTHYLGCIEKDVQVENNSANIRVEKDFTIKIFPQTLYNLENKIDEIVETKRWIGERK